MAWTWLAIVTILAAAAIGFYLIVLSARHLVGRDASPGAAFTILGVRLRRERSVIPLLIGAILVAAMVRVVWLQAQLRPGAGYVPPPDSVVNRPIAGEPSYTGFTFLKDIRVIDLRSRIPVPSYRRGDPVSPVTWTRYSLLERDSMAPDTLQFEFGSTGVDLRPRSLTHAATLVRSTEPHRHRDALLGSTWRVLTDVADEPAAQPFLVITEVTYWNGFSDERSEWAAVVAQGGEEVGIIILFPEDKPFTGYRLLACPHQAAECPAIRDPHVAIPSPNRLVLVLRVADARPQWQYEVRWDW